MSADDSRDQKMLNPLELELQAVESFQVWVPGPKLRNSGRRGSILKLWAILFFSNFKSFLIPTQLLRHDMVWHKFL